MGKHSAATSQQPGYGEHSWNGKPIKIFRSQFVPLMENSLVELKKSKQESKIWQLARKRDGEIGEDSLSNWNDEVDIQGYVQLALSDVLHLAGLGHLVKTKVQIRLTLREHLNPDIVVFRIIGGVMIGIAEVKRPSKDDSKDDLENPKLLKQIVSYMWQLRHTHGASPL